MKPPAATAAFGAGFLQRDAVRARCVVIDGRVLEVLLDELADRVADRLRLAQPISSSVASVGPRPSADLEQAAAYFGRSTRWVRGKAKAGDLPFVRLDGGALAFLWADLEAFALARRVAAGGPNLLAAACSSGADAALVNGSGRSETVANRRVRR